MPVGSVYVFPHVCWEDIGVQFSGMSFIQEMLTSTRMRGQDTMVKTAINLTALSEPAIN
jgi:hypothetical protein